MVFPALQSPRPIMRAFEDGIPALFKANEGRFWLLLLLFFLVLGCCSPHKLNYVLRMHILLFNVMYPLFSISSVFWIAIPPWICVGAAFPFRFDPVFAILGSLVRCLIEWVIVLRAKKEAQR